MACAGPLTTACMNVYSTASTKQCMVCVSHVRHMAADAGHNPSTACSESADKLACCCYAAAASITLRVHCALVPHNGAAHCKHSQRVATYHTMHKELGAGLRTSLGCSCITSCQLAAVTGPCTEWQNQIRTLGPRTAGDSSCLSHDAHATYQAQAPVTGTAATQLQVMHCARGNMCQTVAATATGVACMQLSSNPTYPTYPT
jgi:hypothetical protein